MIVLSVGFMGYKTSAVTVGVGGAGVSADFHGVGWISYGYWFEPNWALLVESGLLSSRVRVSGSGVETASVFPLQFGLRYQPEDWALGGTVRPYVGASVGPYFGSQNTAGTFVEVATQTAIGARLGAGLDIIPSRKVTFGAVARYHAVTNFDRAIGSRDNYSGFEFSLRVGLLLGAGR
jgi:outer membrane protein W